MFNIFAHAGHSHGTSESTAHMSAVDHCMPILIGAGVVVALLLGAIVYFLANWQPKKDAKSVKVKSRKS